MLFTITNFCIFFLIVLFSFLSIRIILHRYSSTPIAKLLILFLGFNFLISLSLVFSVIDSFSGDPSIFLFGLYQLRGFVDFNALMSSTLLFQFSYFFLILSFFIATSLVKIPVRINNTNTVNNLSGTLFQPIVSSSHRFFLFFCFAISSFTLIISVHSSWINLALCLLISPLLVNRSHFSSFLLFIFLLLYSTLNVLSQDREFLYLLIPCILWLLPLEFFTSRVPTRYQFFNLFRFSIPLKINISLLFSKTINIFLLIFSLLVVLLLGGLRGFESVDFYSTIAFISDFSQLFLTSNLNAVHATSYSIFVSGDYPFYYQFLLDGIFSETFTRNLISLLTFTPAPDYFLSSPLNPSFNSLLESQGGIWLPSASFLYLGFLGPLIFGVFLFLILALNIRILVLVHCGKIHPYLFGSTFLLTSSCIMYSSMYSFRLIITALIYSFLVYFLAPNRFYRRS